MAKMHQIRFRFAQTPLGKLQRSPSLLLRGEGRAGKKKPKGDRKGKEGIRSGKRKGEGREKGKEGRGRGTGMGGEGDRDGREV